jgi:hypothetical protein
MKEYMSSKIDPEPVIYLCSRMVIGIIHVKNGGEDDDGTCMSSLSLRMNYPIASESQLNYK